MGRLRVGSCRVGGLGGGSVSWESDGWLGLLGGVLWVGGCRWGYRLGAAVQGM